MFEMTVFQILQRSFPFSVISVPVTVNYPQLLILGYCHYYYYYWCWNCDITELLLLKYWTAELVEYCKELNKSVMKQSTCSAGYLLARWPRTETRYVVMWNKSSIVKFVTFVHFLYLQTSGPITRSIAIGQKFGLITPSEYWLLWC